MRSCTARGGQAISCRALTRAARLAAGRRRSARSRGSEGSLPEPDPENRAAISIRSARPPNNHGYERLGSAGPSSVAGARDGSNRRRLAVPARPARPGAAAQMASPATCRRSQGSTFLINSLASHLSGHVALGARETLANRSSPGCLFAHSTRLPSRDAMGRPRLVGWKINLIKLKVCGKLMISRRILPSRTAVSLAAMTFEVPVCRQSLFAD